MFYRIGVIVFCLILRDISCEKNDTCKGGKCSKSLTVPLLDHLNAPLVANLDISQFNKQLTVHISELIKQGVEQAKKDIDERMQEFVNMFEDDKVNESLVMHNRIENISKDIDKMKSQQNQMETRTIEENERSGNFTSEIVAEVKKLGRQQNAVVTEVQHLKRYKESVISTKEEKDNFTAEAKDELKTLELQLIGSRDDIQLLKNFQASMTSKIDLAVNRISANEQKVSIIDNKLQHLEGEQTSIRSDTSHVKSRQNSISSDISRAFSRLDTNEKHVGFTACVGEDGGSTRSAGQPIPFEFKRTSYNVDLSSVTSNGKFTITTNGLYLVSASLISFTNNAFFSINDGSYKMAYGFTAEHDGKNTYDHSGTVAVVRYFVNGDIITVVPWKTMYIDAWSCLTAVKIK
ncbi:uncharacterized protein LOC127711822 [Mytilus californianus]|uniref:uncharacterized protein LOC127711822 n=1 Tax=Mytilus californianus TaxID=6549 RepID=UPI00224763CE|nr:uncharacterized protein LOC127711822 [Mytilus californianus]